MIEPIQWASTPGMTPLKLVLPGFNDGFDTHFAHCILIEQVQTATTVHEDSRKMESINDWVED